MSLFRYGGWALLALVAGCAAVRVEEAPRPLVLDNAGTTCAVAPLASALLAWRGTSVATVRGTWRERALAAECVVKGADGAFTAVFLAPQMRLATLRVTPPHTVAFECARALPGVFDPGYLLFDLAVVHLPVPALRAALGPDFEVTEAGGGRTVSGPHGTLARVVPAGAGVRRFENLARGYAYELAEVR